MDLARLLEHIDDLSDDDRVRLKAAMGVIDLTKLDALSTDPVTGLLDRDGFRDAALALPPRVVHPSGHLQLVRVDFDRFTTYNARHGRATGDAALRAMADALRVVFRSTDIVGRVGGDDFAVLCMGTGTNVQFGSRIEDAFRSHAVAIPSISPSVATVRANSYASIDAALVASDAAVLQAMVKAAYKRVRG